MSSKSGSLFCPRDKEMQQLMIKIMFGPAVYIVCKDILKLAYKGEIDLFKLPNRIDKHFRVIDRQNVYISEPHAIDVDSDERADTFIQWDIKPNPQGEVYESVFDRLIIDHAERVKDVIEAFKERKIEYYKEGDKKGRVKTAYGFIKMGDGEIRAATDEEIKELEEYIEYDGDTMASS
jgi:hypothetical protein